MNGGIVTLDAMGCQKDVAQRILARQADSVLALKAHHATTFVAVQEHVEHACLARGAHVKPVFDAVDDGRGRLVHRRVFVCPETANLKAEIHSILSSCQDDPAVLVQAIRRHWSIETGLHWVLDVTFREDDSRVRDHTAARNLALLRKIARNLGGRDQSVRASVRGKRKMAAWNNEYRLKLLMA